MQNFSDIEYCPPVLALFYLSVFTGQNKVGWDVSTIYSSLEGGMNKICIVRKITSGGSVRIDPELKQCRSNNYD